METFRGNQPKLLKCIVYTIMEPVFFANFTWTGKTIKGEKKIPFQRSKNIVDLLFDMVVKVEPSYQQATFLSHLKNKIIKYAYE